MRITYKSVGNLHHMSRVFCAEQLSIKMMKSCIDDTDNVGDTDNDSDDDADKMTLTMLVTQTMTVVMMTLPR